MYLTDEQTKQLEKLLKSYFSLPYSTDLTGKDAETLLRIAKGVPNKPSKKKELFDIIDGKTGYSVKTLWKTPASSRVDLQEQRFCDVEQIRQLRYRAESGESSADDQGRILLTYIHNRIEQQMSARGVEVAKSLILLKHWDKKRTKFSFRYWEEDFLGWIQELVERNNRGELEWLIQEAGLHARDKRRQKNGENVRLIRMHYKHNQIFTDHDIPADAVKMEFAVEPVSWADLWTLLERRTELFGNS